MVRIEFSPETRAKILKLKAAGFSERLIGKRFGISDTTVHRICKSELLERQQQRIAVGLESMA